MTHITMVHMTKTTWTMWLQGMRPKTLMIGASPVIMGACAAWMRVHEQVAECDAVLNETGSLPANAYPACESSFIGSPNWFVLYFVLCLIVALGLQIAVNFANDYSDGIRGTDAGRDVVQGSDVVQGGATQPAQSTVAQSDKPRRLVASGVVPKKVLLAAGIAAGMACIAGVAVVAISGCWPLLLVGVACLAAGWFYTGGRNPYGYRGFGEIAAFIFFGPVAVGGTYYAMIGTFDLRFQHVLLASLIAGFNAVSLMLVNNIRDIDADKAAGKRTYAAHVGAPRARGMLYAMLTNTLIISALFMTTYNMELFNGLGSLVLSLPVWVFAIIAFRGVQRRNWKRALLSVGLFAVITAICWGFVFVGSASVLSAQLS